MLQILSASFTSPAAAGLAELLLSSHGRIRLFTALAARLASSERASEAYVADVAGRVHRYYAIALPLHHADEELSIAPCLERAATPELLDALAKMKREHVALDEVLSGLLPLWQLLADEPGRRCELAPAMARMLARAHGLWTGHLRLEEETILPALRGLDASELARITGEIRARRLPSPSVEARMSGTAPGPW